GGGVFALPFDVLKHSCAAKVGEWMEQADKPKYGFDLHKVELALKWSGISFEGAAFDVQLAAYLLDPPEASQTLRGINEKQGLSTLPSDESVYGKGAKFKVPD